MHCWEKIKRFLNCRYCLSRKLQLPGMRNQYFSTSITCSSTHVKVLRLVTTMACLWPTHGIQFAKHYKNFVDNGNQINVAWFSHFLFCFINIYRKHKLRILKPFKVCFILYYYLFRLLLSMQKENWQVSLIFYHNLLSVQHFQFCALSS